VEKDLEYEISLLYFFMRRRYGRKRKVGRTRRFRKGSTTKRFARIAKSVFNRSVETKEARYTYSSVGGINFSSVSYGSAAVVAGLFGAIAQGTGQAQRVGNSIYARGVRIYFPVQAGDNINNLRFICVSPKQGAPIQPTNAQVFIQGVLSNGSIGATQWTYPVDTNRWRVHFDRTFFLNFMPVDGSTSTSVARTRFLKAFVKVNRKIFWDDAGNINNDVYLIAISDSAAVPNPGVIGGFVNTYFKDP